MRRQLFYFVFVALAGFAYCRSHNNNRRPQELVLYHTFDTSDACRIRCRTTCTQHHSEDLMMPRWQCPQQEDDGLSVEDDEESSIAGNLVFIVPAVVVGGLLFLFFCFSCLQRFCRNDDL